MKLLITHHHLGPGGVTRVVANHLLALDATAEEPQRVGLIYDGDDSGLPDLSGLSRTDVVRLVIPEVGYRDSTDISGAADLAGQIEQTAAKHGFADCVLHVHNHSLGKSPLFTAAINELATGELRRASGSPIQMRPLLLQCHDFAEDFRPANYARLVAAFGDRIGWDVYPSPERTKCVYAVLNWRDLTAIREANVADVLHSVTLPNPVSEPPPSVDRGAARKCLADRFGVPADRPYWLYPVRGIRRKNVGELCLIAAAGRGRFTAAVTLQPKNPAERAYFDRWRQTADRLSLPCLFGVGEEGGLSFAENMAAADRIVTTSVAEGFGMVFLESWLSGKSLVGRNLPEITGDFTGVDLSAMYERLNVPVDWFGTDDYIERLHAAAGGIAAAYGRPPVSRAAAEASYERRLRGGCLDFGDLDEELQTRVIERVRQSPDAAERVLAQVEDVSADRIAANAAAVRDGFSLEATGRQLRSLYAAANGWRDVVGQRPEPVTKLLDQFLHIDRIRLIRS